MKSILYTIVTASFLATAQQLAGTNVATQTITFTIDPISELTVSGNPPVLITPPPSAGNPAVVVDNSTFYAVSSNGVSESLTACLSAPMPTGMSLILQAQAPTNATSLGQVTLDTSDQALVTGISQVAQSNLQLTYTLIATTAAGVVPLTTRVVTITVSP